MMFPFSERLHVYFNFVSKSKNMTPCVLYDKKAEAGKSTQSAYILWVVTVVLHLPDKSDNSFNQGFH